MDAALSLLVSELVSELAQLAEAGIVFVEFPSDTTLTVTLTPIGIPLAEGLVGSSDLPTFLLAWEGMAAETRQELLAGLVGILEAHGCLGSGGAGADASLS